MEIMEALKRSLQEFVLPELSAIRGENAEIKAVLQLTNKRIDDIHTQLVDQSRRIDQTNERIDAVRTDLGNRIDQTNARIDEVRIELGHRIDQTNERIDQTNGRIDQTNARIDEVRTDLGNRINALSVDLVSRIDKIHQRIDDVGGRLDRLSESVMRRDDSHQQVVERVARLEQGLQELRARVAA